jgi:hypothetical protein
MSARNLGPPGNDAAPRPGGRVDGRYGATARKLVPSTVDAATLTVALPRLTGCPAGCPVDHHGCGVGEPVATSCHACGALTLAERESLTTCWSVCPLRVGAS